MKITINHNTELGYSHDTISGTFSKIEGVDVS